MSISGDQIVNWHCFDADPDPDPTFHSDMDPDPDADPTQSFTHFGQSENFSLLLFTAVLICTYSYILLDTVKSVIFLIILDTLLIFSGKSIV